MRSLETIGGDIRAMRDKFNAQGKSWQGDDKSRWDSLCAEYDTVSVNAANTRDPLAEKLLNYSGNPGAPKHAARFGGPDGISALGSWAMNKAGFPLSVDGETACQKYGISPQSSAFQIDLPVTGPKPVMGHKLFPRNEQSSLDGTGGGYTVGTSLVPTIQKAMAAYGGPVTVAEVMVTDRGDDLYWPNFNRTASQADAVGENTDHGTADAMVFGSMKLSAYTRTTGVLRVPNELMQDTLLNLGDHIAGALGEELGRKAGADFTNGTGAAGQPTGILTASSLGKAAASATAITMDELIDLEHSINPALRTMDENCGYLMNDSTAAYLRKLKDGEGRPLWVDYSGQQSRLHGWPVTICQEMPAIATGTKPVLFGAMKRFKIRFVRAMFVNLRTGESFPVSSRRLDERFAEYNQTGFMAFARWDSGLLNPGDGPVKHLLMA